MANTIQIPSIINEAYFKKYSPIPDNYNIDEIRPYFNIAETLWVIPVIGLPLYEELLEQVIHNKVSEENSTLLLMIYPYLSFAITYEALPLISVHLSEVGMTIGHSDNSEPASAKLIDYVSNRLRSTVETLKINFKKWIDAHSDSYPLYVSEDCECTVRQCDDCDWILQYYGGDTNAYLYSGWFKGRNRPNSRLQCYSTRRVNTNIQ